MLLPGDAADAVASLKRQPGPDLAVIGSGELVAAPLGAALAEAPVLLIHPLVLGSGRPQGLPGSCAGISGAGAP